MGCGRSKSTATENYAPGDAVSARLTGSSEPTQEAPRRRAPVKPPLDTGLKVGTAGTRVDGPAEQVPAPPAPAAKAAAKSPAQGPQGPQGPARRTSQTPSRMDARGADAAAGPSRAASASGRRSSKTPGSNGKAGIFACLTCQFGVSKLQMSFFGFGINLCSFWIHGLWFAELATIIISPLHPPGGRPNGLASDAGCEGHAQAAPLARRRGDAPEGAAEKLHEGQRQRRGDGKGRGSKRWTHGV